MWHMAAGLWVVLLAGCGIPDDRPLIDLSDEDQEKLCEEGIATFEDTTVDCDGVALTMQAASLSECLEDFDVEALCTATVGDWFACNDALVDDPCGLLIGDLPSECLWVLDCR